MSTTIASNQCNQNSGLMPFSRDILWSQSTQQPEETTRTSFLEESQQGILSTFFFCQLLFLFIYVLSLSDRYAKYLHFFGNCYFYCLSLFDRYFFAILARIYLELAPRARQEPAFYHTWQSDEPYTWNIRFVRSITRVKKGKSSIAHRTVNTAGRNTFFRRGKHDPTLTPYKRIWYHP